MAISEGTWDGSASRFSDAQYESSCVLDREVCDDDWKGKPPKERCSLPIKDPNGDLSRAGVHAAAARIGEIKDACPKALSAAKSKLRSAYKTLGENPPASLRAWNPTDDPAIYRERALAAASDHEWLFREEAEDGYLGILEGHFAVFNRWTEINSPFEGHFMERVLPGAFAKTFKENQRNMRVLLNHGKDPSIGMKPLGPIRELDEDSTGAHYAVALVDTSYNRDLLPGLRDGLYGASFRFAVTREAVEQFPERSDRNPEGIPEVSIKETKVREFGPVTFGAYEEATSGLRSLNDELIGIDLRMMAASDPKVVASFATILAESSGRSVVGANVGTEGREEGEERPEEGEERNDPTPGDYSIAYGLKSLKMAVAGVKASQLSDPDDGDDPDDVAVMNALNDAEAAIDVAIKAQAKDCAYEDDDQAMSETETDAEAERDGESAETAAEAPQTSLAAESGESESAPATRAPDRTRKPYGSTLTKRAAPLKTKRQEEKPPWILP